jgi:glyoxylase-like metal-dependent hydrolase (beta-lactamase superfamily II)
MKIFPLSEGSFTIDKTKLFVPFNDSDDLQTRPIGSLLVEVQPFVIITSKDILLLDTGLGFSDEQGKMQLLKNLADAGINPSDITKVLMTHLHKDHAGGLSDANDRSRLTFGEATYYVQERELKFAFEKGLPSFIPEELEALNTANNVVLLSADSGIIDEYIQYEVTSAHSPYHQVFWIRENEETIFFGGDDAPQLHQMKHRYSAKYDHDGRKAMELRMEWWQKGEEKNWSFLFYHDIKTPVYSFNPQS